MAIKIWKKVSFTENLSQFMNEIRILTKCEHPNIIKLIQAKIGGTLKKRNGYKIKNLIYYVIPYTTNYELFRLIELTGCLSENASKYIFRQILIGKIKRLKISS